jgi:hypothetical protein
MISVAEEKERHSEDSLLHLYLLVCFFLKTWKETELDFFFFFPIITTGVFFFFSIRKRSSQLNY